MEDTKTGPVSAFDALFTTNRIRMLKVLTAWLSPSQQGVCALYIKLLELDHTLRLLHRRPPAQLARRGRLTADFFSGDNADAIALLDELLPYGSPDERSRIDSMKHLLGNMGRIKEMMAMAEMMKEMFPEGFDGSENPMDILSGLAGMDDIF